MTHTVQKVKAKVQSIQKWKRTDRGNCITSRATAVGNYTTHTHTHNRFTALWNLSGKTRVSRYQKNIHPLLSS